MSKCVINFSGGAASYVAAKRALNRFGKDNCVIIFADTMTEDPDLYRFLNDVEKKLGISIINLRDGRNIWQVFKDVRYLGNSRIDPCSRILKREIIDKYVKENHPTACRVFGYSWDEEHRFEKTRDILLSKNPGIEVWAPLMERPLLDKDSMLMIVQVDGIEIPALYKHGAPHNNCGGGCVKAGQAHFKWLLDTLPLKYLEWERREQEMREFLGKDVSILSDRSGDGIKKPLTLKNFRIRLGIDCKSFDPEDWGSCSCFSQPEEEED